MIPLRWKPCTGGDYWSGHATTALALLLEGRGDVSSATAVLRQLVNTGNTEFASGAAFDLAELLERTGDVAGAKAARQQLTDAADRELAGSVFLNLVNLLADQEDGDGLRAAYQAAAAVSNPEALYALDQLGQLLHDRGDVEGAHAVWQEATDAGYEHAEDLREQMMPESEKRRQREAYPPGLPPELNPASILRTGIEVLAHGLPALPDTLTYQMALPVAYWKTEQCAVVLVLRYKPDLAALVYLRPMQPGGVVRTVNVLVTVVSAAAVLLGTALSASASASGVRLRRIP